MKILPINTTYNNRNNKSNPSFQKLILGENILKSAWKERHLSVLSAIDKKLKDTKVLDLIVDVEPNEFNLFPSTYVCAIVKNGNLKHKINEFNPIDQFHRDVKVNIIDTDKKIKTETLIAHSESEADELMTLPLRHFNIGSFNAYQKHRINYQGKRHLDVKSDGLASLDIYYLFAMMRADLAKKLDAIYQYTNKIKQEITEAFPEGIRNYTTEQKLSKFGIKLSKDKNGFLTLSNYKSPSADIQWHNIGVNEEKLFERVKKILGNADFGSSTLTNTGNLEYIGGNAVFSNSHIKSLNHLKEIKGFADFSDSKLEDLGDLGVIGKWADFENSNISSLSRLSSIGGDVFLADSKVINAGDLKYIGGDVSSLLTRKEIKTDRTAPKENLEKRIYLIRDMLNFNKVNIEGDINPDYYHPKYVSSGIFTSSFSNLGDNTMRSKWKGMVADANEVQWLDALPFQLGKEIKDINNIFEI